MSLQKSQLKFQKLLKPGNFCYKDFVTAAQPAVFSHKEAVKVIEEAIEEAVLELRAIEIQEAMLEK